MAKEEKKEQAKAEAKPAPKEPKEVRVGLSTVQDHEERITALENAIEQLMPRVR